MRILVSSAKGANGDGHGVVLAFDPAGRCLGSFGEDGRITDPRGMCVNPTRDLLYVNSGDDRIVALDRNGTVRREMSLTRGFEPGGGVFAPDGSTYCVGSRGLRTVMAIEAMLERHMEPLVAPGAVEYPRGFAFDPRGRVLLASGLSPTGKGDETIKLFDSSGTLLMSALVDDPELSPLDIAIAHDGNIAVSSEWPFRAGDSTSTIRVYNGATGRLLRVLQADGASRFHNPRGLRIGPDGRLYCVGRDSVVAFEYETSTLSEEVITFPGLFGQALVFFG
jgi:DNA-binding beta-propeller fold protein YncE